MALTKSGDGEQVYVTGTPASTSVFELVEFGFNCSGMKIKTGTGGTKTEWSFDGKEIHGEQAASEREYFINFKKGKIYFRGDRPMKFWAWLGC